MRNNLKKFIAGFCSLTLISGCITIPIVAQAEDYTVYYEEDYENDAQLDVTSSSGDRFVPKMVTTDGNTFVSVDQNTRYNNGATLTKASMNVDSAEYAAFFDVKIGSTNNQIPVLTLYAADNSTPIFTLTSAATYSSDWYINGDTSLVATLPNTEYRSGTSAVTTDEVLNSYTWYEIGIYNNGSQMFVEIKNAENDTVVFPKTVVTSLSNAAGIGKMTYATARYYSTFALDNILVRSLVDGDIAGTYYNVTFNIDGNETTEAVLENGTVTAVPDTEKTGFIFKGWYINDDTDTLFTSDEILEKPVTGDITYKALYEEDTEYIEPLAAVEFSSFPENGYPVMGADADTPADNIIGVKLIGEIGTDLIENPDDRVTDLKVDWKFDGFRTIVSDGGRPTSDEEGSNIYCDSYAEVKEVNETSVNFALKNQPFNFYGRVTATVTYNGKQISVSKPMTILGNTAGSGSVLLPRGGYVSDFDLYEDTLVGYEATISPDNKTATDIVTDNWAAYGGNTKKLTIAEENRKKFLKIQALGTNSSCFAANEIDVPTGQVIISQDVRFYNANSSILYKTANPVTWNDSATTFSLDFSGTDIKLNGGESITAASTGVWYHIVLSADVTSGLCYAMIYDESGKLLGKSESVPFSNAGSLSPKYLCYRTPDASMGELDFNNVTVYVPEIDSSKFSLVSADETLTVPEAGEEASTTTLSASAVSTEGYPIIGKAEWTITDDTITGVEIIPDSENSQNAVLKVTSDAVAGTLPIRVSVGGATKDIEITLTSSKDSVRFSQFASSISIPLAEGASDEYKYAAEVVDGDGEPIDGKTVTLAMYDRNNINETTVEGVTFDKETGILTVTSEAKATTIYIRATSTNSNNEPISRAIKVVIHGLAFDFGSDSEEAVTEGYTAVTPSTVYSDTAGYGIEGSANEGGEPTIDNPDSDYLTGTFKFKAKVDPAKVYNVTINYSGTIASEYVNSDLSGVVLTNGTKSAVTYTIPVIDDVLDLDFSGSAVVSSIVIEKQDDKAAGVKPHVYTVGDSTAANNGSWGYVLARDLANYTELADIVTFSNNGRGGKNLSSYYTGGELRDRVLTQIRPGDYVMIGDMGTNGMGSNFEESFNYYVDACIAMGAKVILNSYSPHGPMGGFESGYNAETNTFEAYRKDSYDVIVRDIYEERKDSGSVVGFVDIGKNADTAFNAYVDDYASNGYESRADAANAIIACFTDHNHYSAGPLACQLMIEGYNGTPGIVSSLVDIISADLENSKIKVTMTKSDTNVIVNTNKDIASVKLLKAAYNADGSLSSVTVAAESLSKGDNTIAIGETAPEGGKIKYILLESDTTMVPLCNALEI